LNLGFSILQQGYWIPCVAANQKSDHSKWRLDLRYLYDAIDQCFI
jgi:hypothetical protein